MREGRTPGRRAAARGARQHAERGGAQRRQTDDDALARDERRPAVIEVEAGARDEHAGDDREPGAGHDHERDDRLLRSEQQLDEAGAEGPEREREGRERRDDELVPRLGANQRDQGDDGIAQRRRTAQSVDERVVSLESQDVRIGRRDEQRREAEHFSAAAAWPAFASRYGAVCAGSATCWSWTWRPSVVRSPGVRTTAPLG